MLDSFVSDINLLNQEIKATPMQILVKNNLTIIDQIDLEGHSTSALLELTDIRKKIVRPQDRMYNAIHQLNQEMVSVSEMHSHKLIALNRIDP